MKRLPIFAVAILTVVVCALIFAAARELRWNSSGFFPKAIESELMKAAEISEAEKIPVDIVVQALDDYGIIAGEPGDGAATRLSDYSGVESEAFDKFIGLLLYGVNQSLHAEFIEDDLYPYIFFSSTPTSRGIMCLFTPEDIYYGWYYSHSGDIIKVTTKSERNKLFVVHNINNEDITKYKEPYEYSNRYGFHITDLRKAGAGD
jgi:hypothetical protein